MAVRYDHKLYDKNCQWKACSRLYLWWWWWWCVCLWLIWGACRTSGWRVGRRYHITWLGFPVLQGIFLSPVYVCLYQQEWLSQCFSLFWHRSSFIIKECLIFSIALAFLVNPQHSEVLLNGEWTYVVCPSWIVLRHAKTW